MFEQMLMVDFETIHYFLPSFLGLFNFGFGKKGSKSKESGEKTSNVTEEKTGTESLKGEQTFNLQDLPKEAIDALLNRISQVSGGVQVPEQAFSAAEGAFQASQALQEQAVGGEAARRASIDRIVAGARQNINDQLQQERTRIAAATGGDALGSNFLQLFGRAATEGETQLGSLQGQLELRAIQDLTTQTQAAAQSSAGVADLFRTLGQAQDPTQSLVALANVLRGATRTGTIEEDRLAEFDLLRTLEEITKTKGKVKSGSTGFNFGLDI